MDDPIHHKRLVHGARFRNLPLNVKCPARCAFCYEARVSELLPHIHTAYIPPYNGERFDAFRRVHAQALQWESQSGRGPAYGHLPGFWMTEQGVTHFPVCDAFSAGLSHAQIEELVRMREGDICLLYSVGLNLDPDFIAYLTHKYPETFRLYLSIVTFDPQIRRRILNPKIEIDSLRRVITLTHEAIFFLMLFDVAQLTADVEKILGSSRAQNGQLFIHQLYYDRLSPQRVVRYAEAARSHREAALRATARLVQDGRPVMLALGGDIQAYTRRVELYSLLEPCTGAADEVIFCGPSAHAVIEDYFSEVQGRVVPMQCAFGGNIDLIQGCTARGVIGQLEGLLAAGARLRRVILPSSMFWIDDSYDLNGDEAQVVAEAFPDLSVEVVPIPSEIIHSVVSLDDGLAFFDDPDRP